MNSRRFNLLLFVGVILIAFSSIVYGLGSKGAIQYDYPENDFSIYLPSNWERINQEYLEQWEPEDAETSVIDGFVLSTDEEMEMVPFIIIYSSKKGRISEEDINEHRELDFDMFMQKSAEELERSSSSLGAKVKSAKPTVLWIEENITFEDVGDARLISGLSLNELGWIEVMLVIKPEQFPEYTTDFVQIVDSIRFAERIEYKPESSSGEVNYSGGYKLPFGITSHNWGSWAILIVSVLVTVFHFIINRGRSSANRKIALLPEGGEGGGTEPSGGNEGDDQSKVKKYGMGIDTEAIVKRQDLLCKIIMLVIALPIVVMSIIGWFLDRSIEKLIAVILLLIPVLLTMLLVKVIFKLVSKSMLKNIGEYATYLSENAIVVKAGAFNMVYDRHEIIGIEEKKSRLKVLTKNKLRTLYISKDIEGYEEIRNTLYKWVRQSAEQSGMRM